MSWVTKRSLSIPTRSAGAIQIAPTPGIWWLQWIVHSRCPVVLDERARALERRRREAVEVELLDRDDVVGLGHRRSQSPQSKTPVPDDVGPASSCRTASSGQRPSRRRRAPAAARTRPRPARRRPAPARASRRTPPRRLAHVAHLADGQRVVLDLVAGRDRHLEERVGQDRDLVAGDRPVDAVERRAPARRRSRRSSRARTASGRSGRSPCRAGGRRRRRGPGPGRAAILLARHGLADPAALARGRSTRRPGGALVSVSCGRLDRLDDVHVAGAAADVPLQRAAISSSVGLGLSPQQAPSRSSASPACSSRTGARAASLNARWSGVSSPSGRALDGLDLGAVGLDRQHHAALDRGAVEGTVQAPQLPVSQPMCVPVRPRSSRRK